MVHLRLLGGATIEDESGVVTGLVSRRHPLALLALLATAPSRTLSRGKLVGLLWPESPEEKGRNRLNTYVHQIRSELGEDVLVSVGDDLRLDPTAIACDVCRFEEVLEAGDHKRAVELYGGPFLDGFRLGGSPAFEHRVDREGARLRRGYEGALEALAEEAEGRDEPEVAARWWRERANADRYDSRVTRCLMEALAKAGNPAAALRVARVHAQLLESEFGTEPSAEVQALVEELKERAPAARISSAGAPETVAARALRSAHASEGRAGSPTTAGEPAEPVMGARYPHPASGRPSVPLSERAPAPRRFGQPALLGALVVVGLLGAAVVGGWYLLGAGGSTSPPTGDRGIAVLPFENLGEGDAAVFTEGLHSDLSTRLATLAGLHVISRGSVLRYRESEKPLPEIADELGVTWALRAEVQRAGDEVQVNAHLLDARRDRHVWSESYRRQWTAVHLFEIQGDITRAIVEALEVELSPEDERRLQAVPTENLAAYELYLQARVLDRRVGGPSTSERKVELYRRALELDSTFAEAWAWLADAYVDRGWGTADLAWTDSAMAAAGKALELDPELADAHVQLGDVSWTLGRIEEAITTYEKALELQPSNWEATNNLLALLARRGRIAETMQWLERARRLAPEASDYVGHLMALNAALGRDDVADAWLAYSRERGHPLFEADFAVALFYRGDLGRAREVLDELAEREEGYRITRRRAALALYEGDWREARRHYRALYPGVLRASGTTFKGLLWDPLGLAHALDRLGDREEAREIAREVARDTERELPADPDHMPRHRMAVAHLILGDTATALDWLEEAVDVGYRDVREMRTMPTVAPLREHPHFRALVERMEILLAEERRRIEAEGWGVPD